MSTQKGWLITITKEPRLLDGRFSAKNEQGQYIRRFHYKKDAQEFLSEVRGGGGDGSISRAA